MEGREPDLDLFGGSEGMNDIISELGLADEVCDPAPLPQLAGPIQSRPPLLQ
jgi:hypothetical protein